MKPDRHSESTQAQVEIDEPQGRASVKTTETLRLILGAAALLVAVAVLWWIVGYTLGKAVLEETGGASAFQRSYAFREPGVLRLFALALLSPLTRLVVGEGGGGRWLKLAGLSAAAVFLFGEKAAGSDLSLALFVLAVAATAEARGNQAFLVALVSGAIVAFPSVFETGLGTGEKLLVIALRDAFVYVPLLVGPEWLDRWLWRRR
jgi:hypothetical protein